MMAAMLCVMLATLMGAMMAAMLCVMRSTLMGAMMATMLCCDGHLDGRHDGCQVVCHEGHLRPEGPSCPALGQPPRLGWGGACLAESWAVIGEELRHSPGKARDWLSGSNRPLRRSEGGDISLSSGTQDGEARCVLLQSCSQRRILRDFVTFLKALVHDRALF